MSEPIALSVAKEVDAELVDLLQRLVDDAKSGRIISVAIAAEMTGGEVLSSFSGDFDVFRMLGALRLLEARIMARVE